MLMQMKTLLFFFFNVSRSQTIKNPPARQETWVTSLGQEGSPEEGMATHSSILAGGIPWTEDPGGPQYVGLQRVGHN